MRCVPQRPACFLATFAFCFATATGCSPQPEYPEPQCTVPRDDPRFEEIEVSCDGVDNDCDGRTDVLIPVAANRCETDGKGACRVGHMRCHAGKRQCLVPVRTREAHDGVDNDCDGVIDDVVAGLDVEVRLRVMVPPNVWDDSPEVVAAMRLQLEQQGLPYDADASSDDWPVGFARLDDYSVAVIPGYVAGSITPAQTERLRKWVKRGGVLIMFRVLKTTGQDHVLALAGIASEKRRTTINWLRMHDAPINAWLDSHEEREVLFNQEGSQNPAHLYLPISGAGVTTVAEGIDGTVSRGAAAIRRGLGHGAVYTFGFDLLGFHPARCYVNCFDPGRDILGLLLKGALREATRGHYAVEHTVPGPEPGVFVASHDIDAPDAFWQGPWGKPGALQMAEMERAEGISASYFVTSDYVAGYWRPGLVRELCHRGQCPDAGHSVQHFDWGEFPVGACDVNRKTYKPEKPTLCGEIIVNLKELITAAGAIHLPLVAWRTPYLESHPRQFEYLAAAGVRYDSSLGIGDVRTNLPFLAKSFPYHQHDLFRGQHLFVFPVVLEDGIGWYEGDVEMRKELHKGTWAQFKSRWVNTMVRNAGNSAWTVMLVHPSYGIGEGVGFENVAVKVAATRFGIRLAKQLGLRIERLSTLGRFWEGRHAARIEARYIEGEGYVGKVFTGDKYASGYTLEFGDNITRFRCPEAGPASVVGKRVTFDKPLLPGRIYHFRADVQ